MGLESATWIDELDATNPTPTDPKSQGDDHLRMIKNVLQNQFPLLGLEAVVSTAADLNGNLFDSRLAGHANTGLSIYDPALDVDVIASNSTYTILAGQLGTLPAEFTAGFGFITTIMPNVPDNQIQILYGAQSTNGQRIWQRVMESGIWNAWVLLIDQAKGNAKQYYAELSADGTPLHQVNLSCTRTALGIYTCTFAAALAGANYQVNALGSAAEANQIAYFSKAAGSFEIRSYLRGTATLADSGFNVQVLDFND